MVVRLIREAAQVVLLTTAAMGVLVGWLRQHVEVDGRHILVILV